MPTPAYCTNLLPTASPIEAAQAIARTWQDLPHRDLGLHLPANHLQHLLTGPCDTRRAFFDTLEDADLTIASINAFPQTDFHRPAVKTAVYHPDWTTESRLRYTLDAIDLASQILARTHRPHLSISTLPIAWPDPSASEKEQHAQAKAAAANLTKAAQTCARIKQDTGRHITIDLEPEPACTLSTTADAVAFFDRHIDDETRKHLGLCYDTCHAAVMREDQTQSLRTLAEAGICVNKVQISNAIHADLTPITINQLRAFNENRYQHQTTLTAATGHSLFKDLDEALAELNNNSTAYTEARVHFHIPIHLSALADLGTTQPDIQPAIDAARHYHNPSFEVETYAYAVLPQPHRPNDITESVRAEFDFAARCLANPPT